LGDAMNIDHVTLRTANLEQTRAFLEAVLGLKAGYRPAFSFPGYWLYEGDDPIVHLIPGEGRTVGRDAEAIDHAGFRLDDYDGTRTKLDALGIHYQTMDLADLNERRLFIHTPGGILLELVFRESPSKQP
jgi:catechol 2,3-dioxygenase-like lactoylglutathione lyase family enzyme